MRPALRDLGYLAGQGVIEAERAFRRPEVRRELEQSAARRFERGVRQAGPAWRLEKQRRGLDNRPMRATGHAFQAIVHGSGPAASAVMFKPSKGGVRFGVTPGRSSLYYLQAHAKGYQRGGSHVKPRRVVVLDRLARERIARIVLKRVTP